METRTVQLLPLFERLAALARSSPDHAAITTSGSPPLSYGQLFEIVDKTITRLRQFGVHHQGRVGVVLPTGPEMVVAVLAVAAGAVCVPLNPALADNDWRWYFKELRVDQVLTITGTNDAAERAADDLELPIIRLDPLSKSGAGVFELAGEPGQCTAEDRYPGVQDDAFVLTTSGTTSRPKIVPLTHANVSHSASSTGGSLQLSCHDRLLSVLPLHHAHGLISGLLASIFAGSTVISMRRFAAQDFFSHLREFLPTWYTAVPAIHHAITVEAHSQSHVLQDHSLRLIRSASASLPSQQLKDLESLFQVPVIETYGMTEAASQIASNPLPPKMRKTGSVGLATGPEIVILDTDNKKRDIGETGEIMLRGANITRGYDNGSTDDHSAMQGDWLATGDLGYFDEDGYLFIVGRTKELINRGGEKIMPRKVEDVLLDHPDVAEAVVFSIPHSRLGEDVAAAIVLRKKAKLSPRTLQSFALHSNKLALSELPRHVLMVDEIPRGSTGKIQRNSLAKRLGLVEAVAPATHQGSGRAAPKTEIEQRLTDIWCSVFGLDQVGLQDNFFSLGGDSLLAIQVAIRVSESFGVTLTLRELFEAPTIAELAQRIVGVRSPDHQKLFLNRTGKGKSLTKPVSVSQENILELEKNFKGLPLFNTPMAFLLTGTFDPAALERSLKAIIFRHEVLRTIYKCVRGTWKSTPTNAISTGISIEDWKVIPDANRMEFARSVAANEAWAAFDLTKTPPFRVRLLKLSDDLHVLVLTIHHIIMDGWSAEILVEELFGYYASAAHDTAPHLQKPELQFSDFVQWQAEWCESKEAELQLSYWKRNLSGAASIFSGDHRALSTGTGFGTARVPVCVSNELAENLNALSRHEHCTLFMVLLAGLKAVLLDEFGQRDICVATPMANRSQPNTENMVGLIENTVVVKTTIAHKSSFRDALELVRESVLDAHAHQEMPFEILIQRLGEVANYETSALSEIYFSVGNFYEPEVRLANLEVQRIENSNGPELTTLPVNSAKLMFVLDHTDAGIIGSCIYRESQFEAQEVERLVLGYTRLLELASLDPDVILG